MTTTALAREHRALPEYGLVLGGNVLGWTADRAESFAILDAFVAGGGDSVDLADVYSAWAPGHSGGEAEVILGEWLRSRRPGRFVTTTKGGAHPQHKGLRPETVRAAVDASLARLQVDRIDLYYAHADDETTPLAETVGVFGELILAGKIGAAGLSNYRADRIAEWIDIAKNASGTPIPVAIQPHYNLVHREPVESEIAPLALAQGIGLYPYFGLAAGFLTGKYRDVGFTPTTHRERSVAKYVTEAGMRIIATLDDIAAAHDTTPAVVSLSWLRSRPAVAGVIASASRVEQVAPLLASVILELEPDEVRRLDDVSEDFVPAG